MRKPYYFKAEEMPPEDGDTPPSSPAGSTPPADTTPPADIKATWPENWRELYAGEDEKKLNQLNRYTSPTAALDAMLAAQQRIRSGELKAPFPEKGTEQEQNQWRIDNGLPESPDKYELKFDDGLIVGDEDKPIIDDFLKSAHGANYTPTQVKAAVKWYYDSLEKQSEFVHEQDKIDQQAAEDALRAEWGNEYRGTSNRIQAMFDTAPGELKDQILGGRLADGRPITASAEAMKFFASLALQINPATTLVPAGGDPAGSIEDEIKKIENTMRTDRKAYNADEKMQARYRQLLEWREKHPQR